jgi:hypothetical protein
MGTCYYRYVNSLIASYCKYVNSLIASHKQKHKKVLV